MPSCGAGRPAEVHPARVIRFRRRRLARQRSAFSMQLRPLGTGLLLAVCLLLAAGWAALGIAYADVTRDLPSLAALPALFAPGSGPRLQPTRLYDRTGQHLILALENPGAPRRYLPLDDTSPDALPASLVRMTLAAKDPSFWTNPGYSLSGLLNGSHPTLAQALVADTLLAEEPASLRKNLRERLLAAQITARYGRRQILEWYLNSVDYGHYAVGAGAAAQAFFGKPAHDLNLGEAAVLVAVSNAPALNPIDAPGAGVQLREQLLELLLANRLISNVDLNEALSAPLTFRSSPAGDGSLAPAFTRLAVSQLQDALGAVRVIHGGLTVITTLDLDLQRQTLCSVQTHLLRLQGNPKDLPAADGAACQAARLLPTLAPEARDLPQGISAAAAVLDPQTGELLALTGAATPQRETDTPGEHTPGTLLSPFIYLAGFARGNSPASLVWDLPGAPVDLPNPGGKALGPLRMRSALVSDAWAPAAQLLSDLGAQGVWRQTGLLGLSEAVSGAGEKGFPLSSGKAGLVEVGQAYGVIANQGVLAGYSGAAGGLRSNTILSIDSAGEGRLMDRTAPATQSVVSASLAYLLNSVLSDEPARWPTLGFPNDLEIGRPAGARLGRTLTGDAWAVGYTPQRVVTVWLGPPPDSTWKGSLDPQLAAGLWHALIQWASRDQPARGWNVPAGVSSVRVCDPSGMLPTADCPSVVDEVFLSGNEPTQADTFYQSFQVNRETGRLATVFTPPQSVEQRVFPVLPAAALIWAKQAGLALAPDIYDDIPPQPALADAAINTPAMFGVVRGKVAIRGTASAADFASYRVQVGAGLNPTEWVQVGAEGTSVVTGGTLAEWDTQGLDGLYAVRLLVVHRDQRVETATLQVTVDNTPPKVALVYPGAGETFPFSQVKVISLQAQVEDAVGVARVEWWVDGRLVKSVSHTPFSLPFVASAPGAHSVMAKAYDQAGNEADSGTVNFSFGK
jgi:membrane carboxypeptidase/penicillin-binding protein